MMNALMRAPCVIKSPASAGDQPVTAGWQQPVTAGWQRELSEHLTPCMGGVGRLRR